MWIIIMASSCDVILRCKTVRRSLPVEARRCSVAINPNVLHLVVEHHQRLAHTAGNDEQEGTKSSVQRVVYRATCDSSRRRSPALSPTP